LAFVNINGANTLVATENRKALKFFKKSKIDEKTILLEEKRFQHWSIFQEIKNKNLSSHEEPLFYLKLPDIGWFLKGQTKLNFSMQKEILPEQSIPLNT
jgi:hypothetical protein